MPFTNEMIKDMESKEDVQCVIGKILDDMGGSENVCMTLDAMFRDYLNASDGRCGEDLANAFEMILDLKRILK